MARKFVTISKEVRTYVPKDWLEADGTPEANAFTVKFIPLSKRQLAQFSDNSTRLSMQSNTILLGNSENSLTLFKGVVIGWDNLFVNDKAIEFKKDPSTNLISDEAIDGIDLDVIEEIVGHIIKVSKFPEDELKK